MLLTKIPIKQNKRNSSTNGNKNNPNPIIILEIQCKTNIQNSQQTQI